MINELVQDTTYRPRATYAFAICCIIVTSATLIFPNLDAIFGARESGGISILSRLTVPFQHGFSEMGFGAIPRIVHLILMLTLFVLVARPVEKVIGTFRFVLFTGACWLAYFFAHRLLEMQGHGFHPILWAYSVVLWYILGEGKFIKTRSSFQEQYRLLRGLVLLMWIAAPLMMIFIPLHFQNSAQITLVESAYYGNILLIVGMAMGLIGIVFLRKHIRQRMLVFARKKKLPKEPLDNLAFYATFGVPILLVIVFQLIK